MKNSKLAKVLLITLSLAVMIMAMGVIASAQETDDLSVSILAKNVSYSETVQVLFAVDDTNAGENEVEVLYYLEDPIANPSAQAYVGKTYEKGYTEGGVNYPAFFTAGFPAKNIGDKVYARAHIVGTEVYSEVVRYSVVEYLLERLYLDTPTADQKDLYTDLLSYGASAQKVLINGNDDPTDNITQFVTDYVLVGIQGGTLDGKYSQGIYFPGEKVYPQASGVSAWNVTLYDLATGEGAVTRVANGAEVEVAGFTMISEAPAAYKPDLTDVAGRIQWHEAATIGEYKSAGVTDHWFPSGTDPIMEDGAPYGEPSKVVKLVTAVTTKGQDQLFINNTVSYANAYKAIFETDMFVAPEAASLYEITIRTASAVAYNLKFTAYTDGSARLAGDGIETVTAPGVCGNWFRLRAEYITISEGQVKVAIYYNDMKVAESAPFDAAIKATDITRVIISADKNAAATMYLDNTKVGHVADDYIPDLTDTANRETFESGDALNTYTYDTWIDGESAGSKHTLVEGAPYGESSTVYYYKSVAGYQPEIGFKPKSVSGANYVFYETDMMINAPTNNRIAFEIRGNASTGVGYTFYLRVDGTNVYLLDSAEKTITAVAPVGEWFRIGAEYYEAADGTVNVKLYINGVQQGGVYTGTLPVSSIQKTRFYVLKAGVGEVYYDNVKTYFAKK